MGAALRRNGIRGVLALASIWARLPALRARVRPKGAVFSGGMAIVAAGLLAGVTGETGWRSGGPCGKGARRSSHGRAEASGTTGTGRPFPARKTPGASRVLFHGRPGAHAGFGPRTQGWWREPFEGTLPSGFRYACPGGGLCPLSTSWSVRSGMRILTG